MANTVTVWVRLKDPTAEANRMQSTIAGAQPLILRMRSAGGAEEEDFVFPYSPREMNIAKLSDEMVQIARPGTTPIVAFKSHSLMTIDFNALIAVPGDGLIQGVDKEIMALRRMASSSDKVFQLLNYDIFTRTPFVFRNSGTEQQSGLFFSITDMCIDVTRRNKENSITSANVKISLVENRNPKINVVLIPPLKFTLKIKEKNEEKDKNKKRVPSLTEKADNRAARFTIEFRNKRPKIVWQGDGTYKIIKPGESGYPLD